MTLPSNLISVKKLYVDFQSGVFGEYADQILKSPEFISKYSDVGLDRKNKIENSKEEIVKKMFEKEFKEIVKSQKITSEEKFWAYIDSINLKEFEKDRKKRFLLGVGKLIQ